ncbi:MAG: 50S ribosomal protein L21 [Patescibacteria group bacterium]|nr:50S ribosomal protein L21 [Patescibacteria group bacterium]MCX7589580.1 50S ribosomal protein L21 [Patescibacteria group bacterium]MDW8279861.1 50S ribosomal protein L21 [bacterium]
MNFAVIETGGKQYKVKEGDKIKVEKLNANENDQITLNQVLLKVNDKDVLVGNPYLNNVVVEAKVLKQGRERKKIVFKYHSKTRYRKKKGHRQQYTLIEITKI